MLVTEGRELVRQGGRGALTLRALAERARVTHPAVYRHFPGRVELLAAVATEAMLELADVLEGVGASYGGRAPREAVVAIAYAYVDWAVEEPSTFRTAFAEEVWDKSSRPALRAAADRAALPLLRQVRALLADDSEARVRTLSVAIWCQAHGMAALTLDRQLRQGPLSMSGGTAVDAASAAAAAVRALLAGWPAPGAGE